MTVDVTSPAEEAAAQDIVRLLRDFTLAVERVTILLGVAAVPLNQFLAGLRTNDPS